MTLLGLSILNWKRRPVRTVITCLGVALGIATLYSMLAFHNGYEESVAIELNKLGGHILVVPKGCPYDSASMALHGAVWPCYIKISYLDEVRAISGVKTVAPILMTAKNLGTKEMQVYAGIDSNILGIKPHWKIQGSLPSKEKVLVGNQVAARNQWTIGSKVKIENFHFEVGGILQSTKSFDDDFIFLFLPDAQKIYKRTNEITHMIVALQNPEKIEKITRELRGCNAGMLLNVVPITHILETIRTVTRSTKILLGSLSLITLLAASGGVTASLLMAVSERKSEIGMMRAIGASQLDIARMFTYEAGLISLIGGFGGILLAGVWSFFLEKWMRSGLPFMPSEMVVSFSAFQALGCIGLALGLGVIAAILPVRSAALLPPMLAIRQGSK